MLVWMMDLFVLFQPKINKLVNRLHKVPRTIAAEDKTWVRELVVKTALCREDFRDTSFENKLGWQSVRALVSWVIIQTF